MSTLNRPSQRNKSAANPTPISSSQGGRLSIQNPLNDHDRAYASVVIKPKSGKSPHKERARITPETVKSYLPANDTLKETTRELEALGFRIDLLAPTHINISGEPSLFERTFECKLSLHEFPVFSGQHSEARQYRFQADKTLSIPEKLAKLIDSVEMESPVIYYVTSTPPALSYDHLEVPDDVARGMDSVKAHQRGVTGAGIFLAMVDSGFMTPLHPYYVGKGYTINPVVADPSDPTPGSDDYGHGTGISACALAVASEVSYTVYKLGSSPTAGFSRAVMANPHVITNSWGLFFQNTALQMAINNAVANGIVVLFAAGNGGAVGWPGSEPAVISVGGAFLGSDDSIQASTYASSGTNPINPGRQAPDVCGLVGMAPKGIYIALPTQPNSTVDNDFGGGTFPNGDETTNNDGWVVASGTSSATPMVAAVCALMMQADPTLLGNPTAVRAKLVSSCIDVTTGTSASGESASSGPDNATGGGLVQAYRAVHATDIWMRDNPDSDVGLVPTTSRRPSDPPFTFWTSPDMKVFGAQLADPQADFDATPEISPIFNQDNFVYARVRNRGTQAASSVQVSLFYADPSTSLSFPSDWKNGSTGVPAAGSIKVSGAVSNVQTLTAIPSNGARVTPTPYVWRPPDPSTATQSQTLPDGRIEGHFCLLSRLVSSDDPLTFPGGGGASVNNDNNISMKNEQVFSAPAGGHFFYKFVLRRPKTMREAREFELVADVAALPEKTEIAVEIPAIGVRRWFIVDHKKWSHERAESEQREEREMYAAASGGGSLAVATRTRPRPAPDPEALVLSDFVLETSGDLLAELILRVPPKTPAGHYRFPVAQRSNRQPIGGVTLIAKVER